MKSSKIVFLRDIKKKKLQFHTLESASIFPNDELTLEQLEHVVGGMSSIRFSKWRAEVINEGR